VFKDIMKHGQRLFPNCLSASFNYLSHVGEQIARARLLQQQHPQRLFQELICCIAGSNSSVIANKLTRPRQWSIFLQEQVQIAPELLDQEAVSS
jgi:hypothetical protein